MCLQFLGRFKRFAAVGGSDGVLRGFGESLEEGPRGRFCMLNRRNCTRNGHDWNPMSDIELESLRGGVVFLEGGFAKRVVRTPLVTGLVLMHSSRRPIKRLFFLSVHYVLKPIIFGWYSTHGLYSDSRICQFVVYIYSTADVLMKVQPDIVHNLDPRHGVMLIIVDASDAFAFA